MQADQSPFGIAHGTLASIAFLALLPLGVILLRIPGLARSVWVHAAIQIVGYAIFIAAAGLGIHLATSKKMMPMAHPIIGLILLAVLFFQPFGGFVHHHLFKKEQRRTFVSYIHIWVGRLAIMIGMINGGLGLHMVKNQSVGHLVAYSIVAGVMGLAFIGAIVYGEVARSRRTQPAAENKTGGEVLSQEPEKA